MTGAIWGAFGFALLIFGVVIAAFRDGVRRERKAQEADAAEARVETLQEVKHHEQAAAAQSDADLVARLTRKP